MSTVLNDPNTGYRDINNRLVYGLVIRNSGKHSQITINSTTPTKLTPTPLTGRLFLRIYNYGTVPLFVGFDNTLSSSNGWEILPKASETYFIEDTIDIYGMVASGSADVRLQEGF